VIGIFSLHQDDNFIQDVSGNENASSGHYGGKSLTFSYCFDFRFGEAFGLSCHPILLQQAVSQMTRLLYT
jgi:hypothetical protein